MGLLLQLSGAGTKATGVCGLINSLIIYILTPTHCSHQKAASLSVAVNLQFLAFGTSLSSFSAELDPDVYMKNPEQMESEEFIGKTWRYPFCPLWVYLPK